MKKFLLLSISLLISANVSAAVVGFINSTDDSPIERPIEMIYQVCYMKNGRELSCRARESVRFFFSQEISLKEIVVPNDQVVKVTGIAAIENGGKPIYFTEDDCHVELRRNNARVTFKLTEVFDELGCYTV